MVVLQAIITLVTRSLGKIFSALFGWAVNALFGRTTKKEQTVYSVLVGLAAAWPILLVGVFAPRVATFLLAFVPMTKGLAAEVLRGVWIALALFVPIALGVAFSRGAAGPAAHESGAVRLLRGFPITLAVAGSFLVVLVVAPVRKIHAVVKGLKDEQVPLIIKPGSYHAVAALVLSVLNAHGFRLERRRAGLGKRVSARILRTLGGAAFRATVPEKLEHFASSSLEVTVNPNGASLRGRETVTARAHGLVAEAMSRADVYQTTDADAQAVEQEIKDVWKVFDENPAAHAGSATLGARVGEIAEEIVDLSVPYDDWQILYRETLQLSRAVRGEQQLLFKNAPKEVSMPEEPTFVNERAGNGARPGALTLPELVSTIGDKAKLLVAKEVELAKTELKADVKSELAMAKSFAVAGVALMLGVQMLLVSLAFVLASYMESWLAALVVAAPFLALGVAAGLIGWGKRVKKPLDATRASVKESVEWAKNRLA